MRGRLLNAEIVLFFGGVVGFCGLGLDDDGGVSSLVVLGLGGDGAGEVATGQGDCRCREGDDKGGYESVSFHVVRCCMFRY